ncbi:hypothetical protein ABK730_24070 [Klebsiella indica]|uniref:Uncharacterized protein n=1 Tax=Klebsiella indica TaxID=2582917 RepID=A0A5R9L957_9ENTR|nr:hypothetical protein [Klebsiella indica]TLV05906.1 hypothetical protein FE839_22750 [Klebsiella indica]
MNKIHVISDNRFFLAGITAQTPTDYVRLYTYSPDEISSDFYPEREDIVVLNILDIHERETIACQPGLSNTCCRVIILLSMYKPKNERYLNSYQRPFPWLIPINIRPDEFWLYLMKANDSPLLQKSFKRVEQILFSYLGKGISLPQLVKTPSIGFTENLVYSLKRKIVRGQQLAGHHAITVMACRDIISMSQIYE